MESVASGLETNGIEWLRPSTVLPDYWFVDLDGLKAYSGDFLSDVELLKGRVKVAPEFDNEPTEFFGKIEKETRVTFTVTPADIGSVMTLLEFEELKPPVEKFLRDHPIPQHCAFVMMRFENTQLHGRIFKAVEESAPDTALRPCGRMARPTPRNCCRTYAPTCTGARSG